MLRRGDIHYARLDPTEGRETSGRRPVLIVSGPAINKTPLVVTVVVGTAGRNVKKNYAVNVRAAPADTGLREETLFLCFQIRSLDASRFVNPTTGQTTAAGTLSATKMAEVDNALRLVLDL